MPREQRRFSRTSQALEAQYRQARGLGVSWVAVTTVNISAAGARFRGPEPLEAGEMLEVRIQLPGAHKPLDAEARIIWSKMQASGVTEYGVEFLNISDQQQAQIDQLVEFLGKDPGVPPS